MTDTQISEEVPELRVVYLDPEDNDHPTELTPLQVRDANTKGFVFMELKNGAKKVMLQSLKIPDNSMQALQIKAKELNINPGEYLRKLLSQGVGLSQIKPRESIRYFAIVMEMMVLQTNLEGGWDNIKLMDLWEFANEELKSLRADIIARDEEKISAKTAGVANYLMMISDNLRSKANAGETH